jgi:hypothetical protein
MPDLSYQHNDKQRCDTAMGKRSGGNNTIGPDDLALAGK